VGDPAQIKLMGYSQVLRGHGDSIARAINVSNAQPNDQGVATVNPIFTSVRLAQRIPVRIHLDQIPPDVILAAGMTVTVQIDPGRQQRSAERSVPTMRPLTVEFLAASCAKGCTARRALPTERQ
jgi:multidrug resistance efflux pump